jgi:hypothetical protein
VSIQALPSLSPEGFGTPGYAYLQAYDSNFNLLGQVEDNTLDVFNPLSLNSPNKISYLLIGDVMGNFPTYSLFDDLCYSTDNGSCPGINPTPPSAVPEPNSFGLLILGAITVFAIGFKNLFAGPKSVRG